MTATDIIQDVIDDMCRYYCKYSDDAQKAFEDDEDNEPDVCKDCPLYRL